MTDKYGKQYLRAEYVSRINRVQDYIDNNLGEELTLDVLAGVANFSPYHFHRIFSSIIREPLYKYIQRVRLEKAAYLLASAPKKSITEIALECGFANQSAFARAFKKAFNINASQWRDHQSFDNSKNCTAESKENILQNKTGKAMRKLFSYNESIPNKNEWRYGEMLKKEVTVDVKEVPEMFVAYVRHTGPYQGDGNLFAGLFEKLCRWAGPRGLIRFPETQMLTIYHDSPEVTDEEKLRISVCITVPEDTVVDGDIGKMSIPGGKYAVGHFELSTDEYGEAWDALFAGWLPESGYQPDDRPTFELYLNNPEEHPEKKHIVDIYIPVKPF